MAIATVEPTDEQYKAAIAALESGATKKVACEILGIKYNTTRLNTLIEKHQNSQEDLKRLRKKKRGTPVSDHELVSMIEMYFEDYSLEEIAKRSHRPMGLIKYHLETVGATLKCRTKVSPLNPPLVPEECQKDEFAVGENVWVSGYNCLGEIISEIPDSTREDKVYKIYLLDKYNHRYVFYAAYELGSLEHLKTLGLKLSNLGSTMDKLERDTLLAEALKKARMLAKERKG